jgi:hypothetical protein
VSSPSAESSAPIQGADEQEATRQRLRVLSDPPLSQHNITQDKICDSVKRAISFNTILHFIVNAHIKTDVIAWQKRMETILTHAVYISPVPEQELVMEWIKAGAPHKVRMTR